MRPTLSEIDEWIDALDRAEPTMPPARWRPAFDKLTDALLRARRVRLLWAAPSVLLATAFAVVLHGERWDFEDLQNLVLTDFLLLIAIHFVLTKIYAALERESRIAALLRYYGSTSIPLEEAMP